MDGRTIRVATAADIERVVDLREQMFRDMGVDCSDASWKAPCVRWYLERVADPSHRLLVAEVDGGVVACALGAVRDSAPVPGLPGDGDVLVSTVSTDPGARGAGHGRALTEALVGWARELGVARVELMASEQGWPLYESMGFRLATYPAMRLSLTAPAGEDGQR